jgi:hypothetical protein
VNKISKCPVCKKAWHKDDGIIHTCRKLETARYALKVLVGLAKMTQLGSPMSALNPHEVDELCTKALEETK